MANTHFAALVLATVALTVSGCGGSTKSTTQTSSQRNGPTSSQVSSRPTPAALPQPTAYTAPLSRARLAARANRICSRTSTKRNQLFADSETEFSAVVPVVAAYQRTMYAELGRLTPPPSLASDWTKIVAYARTLAESSSKLATYGQADHSDAAQPLYKEFANARLQLRAAAKPLGFKACAKY